VSDVPENGRRVRVVVVDDEADICLMLRRQLSSEPGVEVVATAGNGTEAVETCRRVQPDAVVMDLLMPVMNGFAAINALRNEFPGVGIVAYTGVAGDFVRQEMARQRIPLVLKSGDIGPLAAAIRSVADGR
jgi:DNA-binding NarL/FixJ family response regulator